MTMTEVYHYGVHWVDGGIAFLHQRNVTNVLGIALKSPFEVRPKRGWVLNHNFTIDQPISMADEHLEAFNQLGVEFMLPTPSASQVAIVHDVSDHHLTLLTKLCSPIQTPIRWANLTNGARIIAELDMTNVQPVVLAGVTSRHLSWVRDVVRYANTAPRKLLLATDGKISLPSIPVLSVEVLVKHDFNELLALPWENYGNYQLRQYMRG